MRRANATRIDKLSGNVHKPQKSCLAWRSDRHSERCYCNHISLVGSAAQTTAARRFLSTEQAFAPTSRAAHAHPFPIDPGTQFFYYRLFFSVRRRSTSPASRLVLNLYGTYQINENEIIRKDLETFTSLK